MKWGCHQDTLTGLLRRFREIIHWAWSLACGELSTNDIVVITIIITKYQSPVSESKSPGQRRMERRRSGAWGLSSVESGLISGSPARAQACRWVTPWKSPAWCCPRKANPASHLVWGGDYLLTGAQEPAVSTMIRCRGLRSRPRWPLATAMGRFPRVQHRAWYVVGARLNTCIC